MKAVLNPNTDPNVNHQHSHLSTVIPATGIVSFYLFIHLFFFYSIFLFSKANLAGIIEM